jgi:hypothetical protein
MFCFFSVPLLCAGDGSLQAPSQVHIHRARAGCGKSHNNKTKTFYGYSVKDILPRRTHRAALMKMLLILGN